MRNTEMLRKQPKPRKGVRSLHLPQNASYLPTLPIVATKRISLFVFVQNSYFHLELSGTVTNVGNLEGAISIKKLVLCLGLLLYIM